MTTDDIKPSADAPVVEMASPALSFGHNLRRANRLTQRLLAARVAYLNLTIAQWYALRALWEEDGITQSDLAERASIAGPALVAAVSGLVARGYLSRRPHPADRRKVLLELTAEGHALRAEGLNASVEVNAEAVRGIEDEKLQTVLRVLRMAQANCAVIHTPGETN